MLYGGLNPESITGVVGPPGSGKTVLSLQFLHTSLSNGRTCLYISANHSEKELISHSKRFGWDLEPYIKNENLILKYIKPVETTYSGGEMRLTSDYLDELPRVVNEIKADVLVIDSITDFLMLCKTDIERRSRLLSLFQTIKENASTALLTAESDVDSDSTKRGIVEYVVDGLIILRRVQSPDMSDIVHVLQVAKVRWTKHQREIRQYEFTNNGIEVYSQYNVLLGGMAHGK